MPGAPEKSATNSLLRSLNLTCLGMLRQSNKRHEFCCICECCRCQLNQLSICPACMHGGGWTLGSLSYCNRAKCLVLWNISNFHFAAHQLCESILNSHVWSMAMRERPCRPNDNDVCTAFDITIQIKATKLGCQSHTQFATLRDTSLVHFTRFKPNKQQFTYYLVNLSEAY